MRKKIGNYSNSNMQDILYTFSASNKRLIKEFIEYCKITAGDNSIKKIHSKIILIADTFQKELNNLSLEDVRAFLVLLNQSDKATATKNDIKKILKRFIKWNYPNWSLKFNQLSDVKLNVKQEGRRIGKIDLLSQNEMRIIVSSVDSLKYKTILLLMEETANRPEEILKLKWKDINFNSGEVKLHSAKTGETREIPLKETLSHLNRYRKECFFDIPRNEDYIFPSPNNSKEHLKTQTLNRFLFELEKKLKFKKHLYPYLWRHSILSKMIKTLSPKVYEMYSGHSLETGMKTYAHLDTSDLREELDRIKSAEELTPQDKKQIQELELKIKNLEKTMLLMSKSFKINIDTIKDKIVQELKENGQELYFSPEMQLKVKKLK